MVRGLSELSGSRWLGQDWCRLPGAGVGCPRGAPEAQATRPCPAPVSAESGSEWGPRSLPRQHQAAGLSPQLQAQSCHDVSFGVSCREASSCCVVLGRHESEKCALNICSPGWRRAQEPLLRCRWPDSLSLPCGPALWLNQG